MNDQAEQGVPHEWPDALQPDMINRLLDIISEKAKIDRSALVPSATMESLNIPSLDMVDILFGVEEEFNIYVPMGDELSHVVYLSDLVKILADQTLASAPSGESQA